jgi:flagellin
MPSILNNVAAMSAGRQIGITQAGLKGTIERLTTGKRINRASDDAAGLAQGTMASMQVKQAHEARKQANIAYFAAQAQDGTLEEATNQVLRAAELVAGGNTGTAELTAVSNLASSAAGTLATFSAITDAASAANALASINAARSTIAATMAQNQSSANLEGIKEENATASMSQIMDADIGAEVVNLAKWQILNQSGISALSQANQSSQSILALLR